MHCSNLCDSAEVTSGTAPPAKHRLRQSQRYCAFIDRESEIEFCGDTRTMPPCGLSISAMSKKERGGPTW